MRIIPPDVPPVLTGLLLGLALSASCITPALAQELDTEDVTTPTEEAIPSASESATPVISPTQTSTVTNLETREVTGEVVKSRNNQITVDTGDETVEIRLFDNIKITRDGQDVEPSDIQTGDHVKAVIDTNSNQAISVEATSDHIAGIQQWIIPAILAALILIGLIYWLLRRTNRQHIKTTTTNM